MGYPSSRKPRKTPSLKTRQKRAAVTRATREMDSLRKRQSGRMITRDQANRRPEERKVAPGLSAHPIRELKNRDIAESSRQSNRTSAKKSVKNSKVK